MGVKASIEIQAITSIRRGKGQFDVASALVTCEMMGETFSERCQIVHRRGELEVGRLNEVVSVSIGFRLARDGYPAQLSVFLVSRLKKGKAAKLQLDGALVPHWRANELGAKDDYSTSACKESLRTLWRHAPTSLANGHAGH